MRNLLRLLAFLAIAIPAFATGTCTQPTTVTDPATGIKDVSHSTIRIQWSCTAAGNLGRIKWGTTTAYGCPGLTGGPCITGTEYPGGNVIGANRNWNYTLTGLQPNTTYYFAVSVNDGSGFGPDSTQASETTLALSGTHPVLPASPVTFDATTPVYGTGGVFWAVPPNTCSAIIVNGYTGATAPYTSGMYPGTTTCQNATSLQRAVVQSDQKTCNAHHGDTIGMAPQGPLGTTTYDFDYSVYANVFTLCDSDDASSAHITTWNQTTGVVTFDSDPVLNTNDRIIIGSTAAGGNPSINIPIPINAGYPYYVTKLSSTTYTLSATLGGPTVVSDGGTGTGDFAASACVIKGSAFPTPAEIVIRSTALDYWLPPEGTRLDSRYYTSQLAVMRNTSPGQYGKPFRLDIGCLAHSYRFLGVEWTWNSVCSSGVPDCGGQNAGDESLASGFSNSHITFDRNYFKGNLYPNRTTKFSMLDGQYMSVINSEYYGMGDWTAVSTYGFSSPGVTVTPSGTSTQVLTGVIYRGMDNDPGCAETITMSTSASSPDGTLVVEKGTDCQTYVTAPTGLTTSCSGTVYACNVSYAASPAPSTTTMNGATVYSRFEIGNFCMQSGHFTMNCYPSGWNTGGIYGGTGTVSNNDGPSLAIAINYGPGPYTIKNNLFHDLFGISIYITGDNSSVLPSYYPNGCLQLNRISACEYIMGPPHDLTFQWNTVLIDPEYIPTPNNPYWRHQFHTLRQPAEFKELVRGQFIGNFFANSFCNNAVIVGPIMEFGNLNGNIDNFASRTTASDIEWRSNVHAGSCGDVLQIVGVYNGFPQQGVVNQRIWIHNNISARVDGTAYGSFNIVPWNGDIYRLSSGPTDVTINNETVDTNRGTGPDSLIFQCRPTEGFYARDNIFSFGDDAGHHSMWYSQCTNPAASPSWVGIGGSATVGLVNATFLNNWMLAGYANSISGTQFADSDIGTVASDPNWPSGVKWIRSSCTPGPCNTIKSRTDLLGWNKPFTDYVHLTDWYKWTPRNYALKVASNYISGGSNKGSDGSNVGIDDEQAIIDQGVVQNVHIYNIQTNSATVGAIMPDTWGCTADVGTDPTFASYSRMPANSGSRLQNVVLAGTDISGNTVTLSSHTHYYYRLNCRVFQPTGDFWTR